VIPFDQVWLTALVAGLMVLAVLAALGSVVIFRRLAGLSSQSIAISDALDRRVETVPDEFRSFRAQLAERGAATEHALWSLGRLDDAIESASATLAAGQAQLETLRTNLLSSRDALARAKAAWRTLRTAIELVGEMAL
jgi:chromosome segregation ATPase